MNQPHSIGTLLSEKQKRFHHACNLSEFLIYVAHRSVCARSILKTSSNVPTFFTDEQDAQRGLLDRVFGNLNDFGKYFWRYDAFIPNVYGPICLIFKPSVWLKQNDIALTQKSVAAKDSDLARDRIKTADELNDLLEKKELNFYSEVSFGTNRVSFDDLLYIVVEPVNGNTLLNTVSKILSNNKMPNIRVYGRSWYDADGRRISAEQDLLRYRRFSNLVAHLSAVDINAIPRLGYEYFYGIADSELKSWLEGLPLAKQKGLFPWSSYLLRGTLQALRDLPIKTGPLQIEPDEIPEEAYDFQEEEMFDADPFYDQESVSDLAPEGMGEDEIDWDSMDFDDD